MKKYFYSDGTNNFGPFTIEELKEKKITRETKVWFQELGEWKPAGIVPEMDEIFKLVPPPIKKQIQILISIIWIIQIIRNLQKLGWLNQF